MDLQTLVHTKQNIAIVSENCNASSELIKRLIRFIPDGESVVEYNKNDEPFSREHRRFYIYGNSYQKDIIKYYLRLNPDRIVFHDATIKETIDICNAMRTGHCGSIFSFRQNINVDFINGFLKLYTEKNKIRKLFSNRTNDIYPLDVIEFLISDTIDYIIYISDDIIITKNKR